MTVILIHNVSNFISQIYICCCISVVIVNAIEISQLLIQPIIKVNN